MIRKDFAAKPVEPNLRQDLFHLQNCISFSNTLHQLIMNTTTAKSTRIPFWLLAGSSLIAACGPDGETSKKPGPEEKLPNIIFIFADDLGYGDLGCFGATDIKTPHIDRMAAEGIKFTEFYSASPVSSPSRAGLLTGRHPLRMGIHGVFTSESFSGMPAEEVTIAEMLKQKNYATGIVGKWHLGHHHKYLPLQQGFDEYFGIPYSNDMASVVYMRGNEVVEYQVDQTQLTKTYTAEALKFIDNHKDKPFFLYLAHNMPHVPVYASGDFQGTSQRGLYGDVVQELDWSVGQVIAKLEALNLLENTLIVFSSDNGPWLVMEHLGGSAGPLREGKQYTFEGGMRVPTVAMWKGRIRAGSVYDDMALQMDWFPTFAALAGVAPDASRVLDGEDLSPVLFGTGKRKGDSYLYFDGAKAECFRKGNYKIKMPFPGTVPVAWRKAVAAHDTLLFDLKQDPGEANNLYPLERERAKTLFRQMDSALNALGKLPPGLVLRTPADHSHSLQLKTKY